MNEKIEFSSRLRQAMKARNALSTELGSDSCAATDSARWASGTGSQGRPVLKPASAPPLAWVSTESSSCWRCARVSCRPVPTQSGHQPCLLLYENRRGSSAW